MAPLTPIPNGRTFAAMKLNLAVCQFRPVKAEPEASLAEIEKVFQRVRRLEPRPRLLVFPETALTGYFLEGGVREHATTPERLLESLNRRYTNAADAACSRMYCMAASIRRVPMPRR